MNTTVIFDKYFRGICHATSIAGEDLGAVRLGLQLALDEQYAQQEELNGLVAFLQGQVSTHSAVISRLIGLEDRLLAWLDEHGKDLPIMLADDYDQRLADVIVEVLNQQRVTIRTQHEALAAQKEAIGRMHQEASPQTININVPPAVDVATLAKNVVVRMKGNGSVSAASTGNPNGTAVTVADPTVPADWTHGEALYVELHRLAQNGIGPSKSRWNDERASGMPLADEVIAKTGLRWYHVLKAAGLMSPTKQSWRAQATEEEGTPANGDDTFRG